MTFELTWIPVHDDEVENDEDDEGDEGVEPADEEHDDDTHQARQKTQPFVIVLEHETHLVNFLFVLPQPNQTS